MSSTRRAWAVSLSAALLVVVAAGWAHSHPGLAAAYAFPIKPDNVGNVVSDSYTFEWIDSDAPVLTGTATIDWYYSAEMPVTYPLGFIPEDVPGEPIVLGLLEADPDNTYTWDVSNVPSGSYVIWSRVNEPPAEVSLLEILSFSKGVITVQHDGDPIYPAISLQSPDNPYTIADKSLAIDFVAFDPDGTGKVTLEAFSADTPDQRITLIDAEPAAATRIFVWDTAQVPEGDYGLHLSIMDDRGLSFGVYTRWFVRIARLEEVDAGTPDAGTAADAGREPPDASISPDAGGDDGGDEGCRCTSPAQGAVGAWWLLLLVGIIPISTLTRRR